MFLYIFLYLYLCLIYLSSFVGVNVNSCSEHLLQRVAGLSASRAKAVVEFRQKNGDFLCREDIKKARL